MDPVCLKYSLPFSCYHHQPRNFCCSVTLVQPPTGQNMFLPYMLYPMFGILRQHMSPEQEKELSPLLRSSVHTQKKAALQEE